MRHWKQQFDPAGPFVFAKRVRLETGMAEAGTDVPGDIAQNTHRMKTWFRGGFIAMKHFDHDEGRMAEPEAPAYEDCGGGWYLFPDGTKVHGKKALAAKLQEV